MADDGVEQSGQQEFPRFEVTRTCSSCSAALMEVISNPSGNGSHGVIGILLQLLLKIDEESVASSHSITRVSPKSIMSPFSEMGYSIDRTHAIPDFICTSPMATFCVEATTVNATRDRSGAIVPEPEASTPEEMDAYLNGYMPIKFGSALTSKLAKRYWERPHVAGKPLILAVQDFSSLLSLTRTRSAFERSISAMRMSGSAMQMAR
jgi:hypothetical protein